MAWWRPTTPPVSRAWPAKPKAPSGWPRKTPLRNAWNRSFDQLTAELVRWQPDVVAIEEVFYSVNAKSALKLGQVRGVALLAAACQGLPVAEYAPLHIKSSVVGYGMAQKRASPVHGRAAAGAARSA